MSDIEKYCLDRICRLQKLYDEDSWEINVGGGYYGEEIYSVGPTDNGKNVLSLRINELFILNDLEKIKALLICEYGYLIPIVEKANSFKIKKVKLSTIQPGNEFYFSKLNEYRCYDNYDGIISVCFEQNGNYRIIDGYNRYASAKFKNKDIVSIIILK